MPKSQPLNPNKLRAKGEVRFQSIKLNAYDTPIESERENLGDAALMKIYRDMAVIREFETMINLIKTAGEYRGVSYNHPGPAHLSIGQEASAVGQAFYLRPEDFIFGSHRSHGEILAKGLSAIAKLDERQLTDIMEGFLGGRTLRAAEGLRAHQDVKQLAYDFLIYGAMAEIFARETGFNKGLGGSMHAFFTPFGIYPNNAIVGGSGGIAAGAALYKRVNRQPGVVISNIGDGSLGCGPVLEALNFAAMDQFGKLWDDGIKGGLPILFNIFNNGYGMGGQTAGETMGYDVAARLGAGFTPTQMHAERVDGFNPLAVIEAMGRKLNLLRAGEGPALLDVLTYRFSGHSPSDSSSYRSKEEIADWEAQDPMLRYPEALKNAGVASGEALAHIPAEVSDDILRVMKAVIDDSVSPRINMVKYPDAIADIMFSNEKKTAMAPGLPETLTPKAKNPRVQAIAKKERFAIDKSGKPVGKNRVYQLRDGLFEAIIDRFYEDPTLIAYGEDNRDWGGAFAVYRGLTEALPYRRFFNAPISEAAIVASAVGYAMCGGRAIAELMYCDFIGRAGDEVFNQLSKWQAMSAGILKMPVVLRVSVGSKYGAQHSQDWSALCAHIPGLKVAFPATPYDAKGLMNAALTGTDPVVFLESQRIYDVGEMFHEGGVPEGYYEVPLGLPDIKRAGKDITILSIGATLYRALEAAEILKEKYGLSAEVIDARSIVPFDYALVVESVKKTGRVVVTGDACNRCSVMSEMARVIGEVCFDDLDAPPVVVGAQNWITPAHELEERFFPQPEWIIDAIDQQILPLKGHVSAHAANPSETLRNARRGV